jgi:glutamine synthetase
MNAADVMKLIEEKGIKFVDYRFTDTRGKEQHVTVPVSAVDEDVFEDGKMFDGSSIAGWKGIQESDMILMPDPVDRLRRSVLRRADPVLTCDVIEPNTMQGYERDPRSLARRAEAYLKSTGIADTAYFGPENEFFIFDDIRWGADISGCFYKIDSSEAGWNSERAYEGGNFGHRPGTQGRLFPGAAGGFVARYSLRHVPGAWKRWAQSPRSASSRSRHRRPVPRSASSSTPWCARPTKCSR